MDKGLKELIDALVNQEQKGRTLKNTFETWERIGNKDSFPELEVTGQTIKDWIEDNPYDNI